MRENAPPERPKTASVTEHDLTSPPVAPPPVPSAPRRTRSRISRPLSERAVILCSLVALVVVMLLRALVRAGGG